MGGRLVWAAPAASGLLLAATGAVTLAVPVPQEHYVAEILPNVVLGLVLPLLGAVVLSQLPRHPLGRLWLATGLAGALTLAVHTYAQFATEVRPGMFLGTTAAWFSSWLWVLGFTPLLTFGLLLFPDGQLLSRRWRPVLLVAGAAVVLPVLGQALAPGPLAGLPVTNPLGLSPLHAVTAVARSAGFVCFTLAAAAGAAALVMRWRRGSLVERQQLALPALAAGLLGATFLVPAVGPLVPWLDAFAVAELTLLFFAFGVAVLRDRVTGAEVVLRRSLTYGFLTATLTLTYAAFVAAFSTLVDDRGADLLATLGVALVVLPLRDRLQRLVDQSLYGERADPFAALDRLQQRLDGAADPEAVLRGVAESVAAILRLPAVQVLVGRPGEAEVVAAVTGHASPTWQRVPLRHHDEEVGALLIAPRVGQSRLDPRDLRMLEALTPQAAAAVAAIRMSAELQLSRQRIVAAREEERRRLRRDLHDGLGPTLAGIGLGLEVARASLDPDQVDRLLEELKTEAAMAVLDVRRLVEDLRPPALDELGLVGALRQHADRITHRDGCAVTVTASTLQGLPAAVEVAAYRIAMEALTNAVRHAAPSTCRLVLGLDDELTLEVTDDGTGFVGAATQGVGITAMRERATELGGSLTVGSSPAGGTTVLARIPVQGR